MMNKLIFKLKCRKASPEERAQLYIKQLGLRAGDGCRFFGDVDFGSEPYLISLGNQVMMSSGVHFSTHDGGMQVLDNMGMLPRADNFGCIRIEDNVFLGMGVIVLKGVTIGENTVVGAGAIVTKSLPGGYVYAGIPARRICSIEEYCAKAKTTYDQTFGMPPEEKREYLMKKYGIRGQDD